LDGCRYDRASRSVALETFSNAQSSKRPGRASVSTNDLVLFTLFGCVYLAVALAIGVETYKRGRKVLFAAGFIMPPLWLVGAIAPAKKGSTHGRQQSKTSQSAHHESSHGH
jgi:hypothetical protein